MQRIRGKLDEAIADLEGAYKLLLAKDRFVAVTWSHRWREGTRTRRRPTSRRPQVPRRRLRLARRGRDRFPRRQNERRRSDADQRCLQSPRAELTNAALLSIRNSKVKNSVEPILRLAPTFHQEYLLHAARKTDGTVATSEDAGALVAALVAKSRWLSRLPPMDWDSPEGTPPKNR